MHGPSNISESEKKKLRKMENNEINYSQDIGVEGQTNKLFLLFSSIFCRFPEDDTHKSVSKYRTKQQK